MEENSRQKESLLQKNDTLCQKSLRQKESSSSLMNSFQKKTPWHYSPAFCSELFYYFDYLEETNQLLHQILVQPRLNESSIADVFQKKKCNSVYFTI